MPRPQRDQLAPAHAGLDERLDHEAVLCGHRVDQALELVGCQGPCLAGDDLRQLGAVAGVTDDQSVADGSLEDRVQDGVVLLHRPGREAFRGRLRDPVLNQRRGDLRHRPGAEERVEVLVEVRHVRRPSRRLDVLARQPVVLHERTEGDVAELRVMPASSQHLLLLAVGGTQRLPPGPERARRALAPVRVAIPAGVRSAARTAALGDPCHRGTSLADLWANCGQTLPDQDGPERTVLEPINASDLRVYRNCRSRDTPANRPKVFLITQRSQVQILPPLQSEIAGQSRVRGLPRARFCCRIVSIVSADAAPTPVCGSSVGERQRAMAKVSGRLGSMTSLPVTQRSACTLPAFCGRHGPGTVSRPAVGPSGQG